MAQCSTSFPWPFLKFPSPHFQKGPGNEVAQCWMKILNNNIEHRWPRLNTVLGNVARCWKMLDRVWLCFHPAFIWPLLQKSCLTMLDSFLRGFKAQLHSRKMSTDRAFSENIIVKSQTFSTSKFVFDGYLCRPITFYKIFFLRKIFLSGNVPL
jgi:hypothetical protein